MPQFLFYPDTITDQLIDPILVLDLWLTISLVYMVPLSPFLNKSSDIVRLTAIALISTKPYLHQPKYTICIK